MVLAVTPLSLSTSGKDKCCPSQLSKPSILSLNCPRRCLEINLEPNQGWVYLQIHKQTKREKSPQASHHPQVFPQRCFQVVEESPLHPELTPRLRSEITDQMRLTTPDLGQEGGFDVSPSLMIIILLRSICLLRTP